MNKANLYYKPPPGSSSPRTLRWVYLLTLIGIFALPTSCQKEEVSIEQERSNPDDVIYDQIAVRTEAGQDSLLADYYVERGVSPYFEDEGLSSRADEVTRGDIAKEIVAHPKVKYVINYVAAINLAVKRERTPPASVSRSRAMSIIERHVPDFKYRLIGPYMDALKEITDDVNYGGVPYHKRRLEDPILWELVWVLARNGWTMPTFDKYLMRERPSGPCTTCPCSGCDDLPDRQDFPGEDIISGGPLGGGVATNSCAPWCVDDGYGCNNVDNITCENRVKQRHNRQWRDCGINFGIQFGVTTGVAAGAAMFIPVVGWAGAAWSAGAAFLGEGAIFLNCANSVEASLRDDLQYCEDDHC